jgi:hypothetical protein
MVCALSPRLFWPGVVGQGATRTTRGPCRCGRAESLTCGEPDAVIVVLDEAQADRGEQRWRGISGPRDLTAQDGQLMAQNGNLDVLRLRRRAQPDQAQQTPDDHETERPPHHNGDHPRSASSLVTASIVELHPSPLVADTISQHFDRLLTRYEAIRNAPARAVENDRRAPSVEALTKAHRMPVAAVKLALIGPPLPPIRLHDLRHVAATLAYRATKDLKLVSQLMGHSGIQITADTYTSIFGDVDRDAAEAIAAIVPRANR